jgi:hypothetical protein
MNSISQLIPQIRAFRPFLPAQDYQTSLRFYKTLGFDAYPLGDGLAELNLGPHAFLLQDQYVKEWAENTVVHVLVEDVRAWWRHIESLNLAQQFNVQAPVAPHIEPWGLAVAYVFDPSGLLWHFAQDSASYEKQR